MKKYLFYPALWGILTLSIFYSCRTDSVATEQTQQVNEKIGAFERFEKANNIIQPKASSKNNASSEKYVSYAAPFSEVITNFLKKHSDYRERLEKEVGKIRLDVSSTTFGEGAKGVLFPVTDKNGKVIGAWAGIVNEERDYVKFYYLNNSSQEVASIKNAFQSYYDRNKGKLASLATASKSTSLNPIAKKDVTEIEEVVITVTKPDTNIDLPWWWYDSGWTNPNPNPDGPGTGMEGGPGVHGGGTNGTENNNQQDDSCAKLKAQQNSEEYKKRVDALEKKLKETHENGYIQDKDGNYSELTQRGESESSKSMRLPNDISNLRGFLHTHVKKTSVVIDGEVVEAEGVDMFSPADVERFLEIVKFSSDQGRSLDDAFGVMVSSSGNYTLKFTGDKNQIITKFQDNSLNIGVYLRYMQQTSGEFKNMSMEQKFLKYLDEYMNARGVSLYKDNKDGTNTRMDLNDSNKKEMKKSDC
ncbi:hypothetical protein VO54_03830 [Elizabethkingia miricola]|nr:hypothetical protein VO54_03830 [Elizabethkingia miricola]